MTEYYKLPDNLSVDELKKYFTEFLEYYKKHAHENTIYASNELLELADRQWHTYQILDSEILENVERYLHSIINYESEELIDTILCIIPRLGLKKLYNQILRKKDHIFNRNVRQIIENAFAEYSKDVENPYSGMLKE